MVSGFIEPTEGDKGRKYIGRFHAGAKPRIGSAEEAEFAVRNKRMDAAVVDVFLPGRSGATLMSRLREKFPNAVLIGVSAMSDAAMARKCKGLGADLFIGKPVLPEKLAQALQSKHTSWH